MLDRSVSGRIFFEQVLHDNLDIAPDQVSLIFDRRIPHGPQPHRAGSARVITHGSSVPAHRLNTPRSSSTTRKARRLAPSHDQRHPTSGSKRLTNLPTLRQIGFSQPAPARRPAPEPRPDPWRPAFTELTAPIITDVGTRIPGLRFGDQVHALLQALLIHRLLPHSPTECAR
jgi:hypothetical protein